MTDKCHFCGASYDLEFGRLISNEVVLVCDNPILCRNRCAAQRDAWRVLFLVKRSKARGTQLREAEDHVRKLCGHDALPQTQRARG